MEKNEKGNMGNEMNHEEGVQSRRQFFKSVAKKTLPLLGGALLISAFTEKAKAQYCNNSCVTGCGGNCKGTCTFTCHACVR